MIDPAVAAAYPTGRSGRLRRTITLADVQAFAKLSGDENPIHVDPQAAAKGRFGKPVVHGAFVAAHVSALLGTTFPGPGTIFVAQSFRFLRPVFAGDDLTAVAEVTGWAKDRFLQLRVAVERGEGAEKVLDGEVTVLPPGGA